MVNLKQKKVVSKVVISKIEITKPSTKLNGSEKVEVDDRSLSLQKYHSDIGRIGKEICKFALTLSKNLLSVKMALMQAVQEVERKMRENKEKG